MREKYRILFSGVRGDKREIGKIETEEWISNETKNHSTQRTKSFLYARDVYVSKVVTPSFLFANYFLKQLLQIIV